MTFYTWHSIYDILYMISYIWYPIYDIIYMTLYMTSHIWHPLYDTLSQQTLLSQLPIQFCVVQKILFPLTISISFSMKNYNALLLPCPHLSHLISCRLTKSDSHLANSLAAAVSEPALYRIITFHVLNLMSLFHCLGRTKVSVLVRDVFNGS